jgi:hypothetical protein
MPQIRLKQNSPDFIDPLRPAASSPSAARINNRICDMPGCRNTGDHRAPKDRSLSTHYFFCLDHVQEYNAAWNFFAGMQDCDVEQHIIDSFYGDRPTWRADSYRGLEAELHRKIHATRFFTDDDSVNSEDEAQTSTRPTGNPTLDALNILNLSMPVTFEMIKKRYRALVKKYHPDHLGAFATNRTENEEILKRINMAYTVLKMKYAS